MFPADVIECFILLLAYRCAMALTGDKGTVQGLFQQYSRALKEAQSNAGGDSSAILDADPDWIRARGFNSSQGNIV